MNITPEKTTVASLISVVSLLPTLYDINAVIIGNTVIINIEKNNASSSLMPIQKYASNTAHTIRYANTYFLVFM